MFCSVVDFGNIEVVSKESRTELISALMQYVKCTNLQHKILRIRIEYSGLSQLRRYSHLTLGSESWPFCCHVSLHMWLS